MCGICGLYNRSGEKISEALLWQMTRTLAHRGPDDSGVYRDGETIGLGQTRLSIIDLSPSGHQPMVSSDGDCCLVYNGEVYNYLELRGELISDGIQFRGDSDSEVVLQAYLHWGVEAFQKLDGQFAFAIWDRTKKMLYAVRDRFGIKPFYYLNRRSRLVFGSEIKAILAATPETGDIDPAGLSEFLYFGTTLGDRTFYNEIKKLKPGHYLQISDKTVTETPYMTFYDGLSSEGAATGNEITRPADAIAGVRTHLENAVRRHLVSDVPVGVFLSGGLDSSTITAFASRHYEGKLSTFSVGFDFDKGHNELPQARQIAELFGTKHNELQISGKDIAETIVALASCHDQPFGDAANIPLYLMCEKIKGDISVILQGDGGDEIFAGYRRYNVLAHGGLWHLSAPVPALLRALAPRNAGYYRLQRFFNAVNQRSPADRMALLLTEESPQSPPTRILSSSFRERIADCDPFAAYRVFHDRFKFLDPVQQMLYTDCGIILPDTFLEKVDRATMAHSIEVRVPLLDNTLARYVMGLPSNLKVRRGEQKWLLRQAMKGILPGDIISGRKQGFGVPYSEWLRNPLAEFLQATLTDPAVKRWGIFDQKALETCIAEHRTGRRNNGYLLYKALQLALWRILPGNRMGRTQPGAEKQGI
jgi:asparagine synthase (glutamine-hydrolysing)